MSQIGYLEFQIPTSVFIMGSVTISNFVGEYFTKIIYDKLSQNLKIISGMEN